MLEYTDITAHCPRIAMQVQNVVSCKLRFVLVKSWQVRFRVLVACFLKHSRRW